MTCTPIPRNPQAVTLTGDNLLAAIHALTLGVGRDRTEYSADCRWWQLSGIEMVLAIAGKLDGPVAAELQRSKDLCLARIEEIRKTTTLEN